MVSEAHITRATIQAQLFWEGNDSTKHWFAFVNRSPMVPGHVLLVCDAPGLDTRTAIPVGFEDALRAVTEVLLSWADQHKARLCVPVVARLNLAATQFRVHVLPLSPVEIAVAADSARRRHPDQPAEIIGGFAFLGAREDAAVAAGVDLEGAIETAEQMRAVALSHSSS
jgi:diadenosine tetraphosphate (Ap4A) HIT family hydrolase